MKKSFKESIAKFFEEPTRDLLKDILKNNIGELENLDFKDEWPQFSKVAKHILAMANSGGGVIVLGVTELQDGTFDACGIKNVLDKADIDKGIRSFIPEKIEYEVLDFSYEASEYPKLIDKCYQVIIVNDIPESIPFISMADGDGIRKNSIYFRRGTNSEEVTYKGLQEILDRRLKMGYSLFPEFDLIEHLSQLKVLYEQIQRYHYQGIGTALSILTNSIYGKRIENPLYPKEGFDEFIVRMIDAKKKRIEAELDLKRFT